MLSVDLRNAFNDRTVDNFTCLLLRLIAKADPGMCARLAKGFPVEVEAVRIYQTECPYVDPQETGGRSVPDWEAISRRAVAAYAPPIITWGKYRGRIEVEQYTTGNTCLRLVQAGDESEYDLYDGEPLTDISKNIAGYRYDWDIIHVKDYSENAGLLEALQMQKIVGEVIHMTPSGFVALPVVKIIHPVLRELIKRKRAE